MLAFVLAASCLLAPVQAPIVDHFREPSCTYCAGNRGLEYATVAGTPVRAAGDGVVSYSGTVAGERYVVVAHPDSSRATYGRLDSSVLRRGDHVRAGHVVGVAGATLYFGLRVGDDYVDPEPLLGRVVLRPHLVPLDGSRRRPGRPATLTCSVRDR
jgi:murein DD-endopeptidase MepM/ murein hydrolase activator NlpD